MPYFIHAVPLIDLKIIFYSCSLILSIIFMKMRQSSNFPSCGMYAFDKYYKYASESEKKEKNEQPQTIVGVPDLRLGCFFLCFANNGNESIVGIKALAL